MAVTQKADSKKVNPLKRKASRWQTLPPRGEENGPDIEIDNERYSLMIFLRDMKADEEKWSEFMELLLNAPGIIDESSIAAQLLEAVQSIDNIDHDYINPATPNAKRRRLDIVGNAAAGETIAEYTELIHLARTLWQNPEELDDIIGDLYQHHLGQQYGDENYSLDSVFGLARSWGEVRYRFMNHLLRDDPHMGTTYNAGRPLAKGNAANAMVHESNVLLDSRIVEFSDVNGIGFTPADRAIFEQTYLLTPEEGRNVIKASSPNLGLRIGLPQVFSYCARFIDALVDWRVRVLEASRKQALASTAYRQANGHANKQAVLNARHQSNHRGLAAVDQPYANDFIPTVRLLLGEAYAQNAFNKATFDKLETTVRTITQEIQRSQMNRVSPELARNFNHSRLVNSFPGQTLVRPTGTSIINPPRRPLRNRGGNP